MFVNPLHRARVGEGIALNEVAARTCLSPRIVQLIDAGEFDRLPGGIYARSYVRAFAAVVGLDPEDTIRELSDRLPPDEDPLPVLRANARTYLPPFVRDLARWVEAAKESLASRFAHVRAPASHLGEQSRRLVATSADLAFLVLFYAVLLRTTGWVAGVDFRAAVDLAGLQAGVLWLVIALLYFLLLGGIGGRTPGATLCRLRASSGGSPLGLRAICHRALFRFQGSKHRGHDSRWDGDAHEMSAY